MNQDAINEYDARSMDLIRELRRSAERQLSEATSAQSADEAMQCLYSLKDDIERLDFDMDRRIEIRDGVTDVGWIAKQQLSTAVQFGQPERIERLLKCESLHVECPWLKAVEAIRMGRSHDRLTDSQYAVCLKIVAVLEKREG